MHLMPLARARAWLGGVASQSTFRNQTAGACCAAQPCRTGSMARHGPHQDAEKSTTTSRDDPAIANWHDEVGCRQQHQSVSSG